MIYQIVLTLPDKRKIGKEKFNSIKFAERKIESTYKDRKANIIQLPEKFTIGLKVYTESELYATIIEETNCFWVLLKINGERTCFQKLKFEEKYVEGVFVYKEESEVEVVV